MTEQEMRPEFLKALNEAETLLRKLAAIYPADFKRDTQGRQILTIVQRAVRQSKKRPSAYREDLERAVGSMGGRVDWSPKACPVASPEPWMMDATEGEYEVRDAQKLLVFARFQDAEGEVAQLAPSVANAAMIIKEKDLLAQARCLLASAEASTARGPEPDDEEAKILADIGRWLQGIKELKRTGQANPDCVA